MFILSTPENILLFVAGFGVFQGVFSAILLYFHPKADRSVNRFLSLYILSLTLPVILPLVMRVFSWQVIIFIEPFITFMPVFLYLYVRSFKEVITWRKAWPHFIFFVVSVGFAIWVYAVIGSKYPPSHPYPEAARNHVLLLIPFATRILHRIIYYFLSLRELRFYQRSILHLFSDTTEINLNWIRWLVNGFLLIIISAVTVYFIMSRYPQYFDWCVLGSGVFIALNVLMATFKGTTQLTLWQVHQHITKETLETDLTAAGQIDLQNPGDSDSFPAPKNRLNNVRIDEITEKIFTMMNNEKVYQEPDLTLQMLADKIKIPPYQVSLAINEGMQKTFYELVNGHRVEEAKRLLLDSKNKNYTILSVGFEAGFNSKTTFNTVFKKFTGLTPTEYREKQKETPA